MKAVVFALILSSTLALAEPQDVQSPLAGIAWLVGGQWEAKTELPSGQAIESRMVCEFGPGQWSMRMLQYIQAKEGEYQQYETFLWADPQKPRVQFITFSSQGAVIRGEGEIKDGVMTLHQAAAGLYPEMRSIFRPDAADEDKYVGENWWNQKAGWKQVMTATSVRKKLASPPKLKVPERRGKLDALSNFAGGEFRFFEEGKELPLGRHFNRYSIHGRALVGWSFTQKYGTELPESMSVIWVDAASGEFHSVSVAFNGTVTTGVARVEGLGITWDTTDTPRTGESETSRTVIVWTDDDNYEMRFFNKVEDAWKLSPFAVVGRREKPTR